MRKIYTTTFVTLDGVMQAPGGTDEDRSDGFNYGGWQFEWNEPDKTADDIMNNLFSKPFDLLLGRLTYNMWAQYWPKHKDDPQVGAAFEKAQKYVVSHNNIELPWSNSKLITGNVVKEIEMLKNTDGPDLSVWGSSNLIQTLLKNNLVDQMNILTYPITLGSGKKLFQEDITAQMWKRVDGKITDTGVIYSVYEPSRKL